MRTLRTIGLALGALLLAAIGPGVARATSGTCTVTNVAASIETGGPGGLRLPPATVANGLAMPVELDEATGAFSLSRDTWAAMFGAAGAEAPTGFGGNYFLIMAPGAVAGTIDAAGNITLPGFTFTFSTDVCEPPKNSYPVLTNLDSALQFVTLGLTSVTIQGAALDFSTGVVTLKGADEIPAPCLTSPLVAALTLTCQLSPLPDRTKLPPAPTLTKLAGVGKIGKPLPTTPGGKPDKGDVLTLGATLTSGAAKFDFTQTVFIRLGDMSGNDLVVVDVPAGKLTRKRNGFQVTDTNGTVIEVLVGQKSSGPVSATTGGTLRFTQGKKGVLKMHARLQGLDLSGLSPSGSATVAVGPYAMTASFAVRGGGKRRLLH